MHKIIYALLCASCFTLLLAPAAAQDDTDPLAQTMHYLPADWIDSQSIVLWYQNRAGIYQARPGVPQIDSLSAFARLTTREQQVWDANARRMTHPIPGLLTARDVLVDGWLVDNLEFYGNPFAISHSLTFYLPLPPATPLPYAEVQLGRFNPEDLIRNVDQFTDFTLGEWGELRLTAWAVGLDEYDTLLMAPNQSVRRVEAYSAMLAARAGAGIQDATGLVGELYAVAVANPQGDLLQAILMQPNHVIPRPRSERIESEIALDAGYQILPMTSRLALLDYQDGQEQVAQINAVFADAAEAEWAGIILTYNLELLAEVGGYGDVQAQVEAPVILSLPGDAGALLSVSVRYPMPSNEPDAEGRLVPSGVVFRAWADAVKGSGFGPILVYGLE
jgi:hypothetical protein